MQKSFLDKCASDLGTLIPKRIEIWESVLSDIFYSPSVTQTLRDMVEKCNQADEFECIGVDCAVKPSRPLLGQSQHNKSRKTKQSQAAPYREQIHAIR